MKDHGGRNGIEERSEERVLCKYSLNLAGTIPRLAKEKVVAFTGGGCG